jgi:tyrosyl-tRNA synthetase
VLAAECTGVVHGREVVAAVEAASRILFSGSEEVPDTDTIAMLAREMPTTAMEHGEIGLIDLLVQTRLAESKSAARKLIEGGGVYLNHERQTDLKRMVSAADVKWPDAMLLRAGKKNYHLVTVR